MRKYSEALHDECIYCCWKLKISQRRFLPVCDECTLMLRGGKFVSIRDRIVFLVGRYRVKYALHTDPRTELFSGGVPVADQVRRVSERCKGEKKVRGLTSTYKYYKLLEDILDQNPEEHLRLKIEKKVG